MAASPAWITDLHAILEDSEIIPSDSQLYDKETKTWAAQKNSRPKILLRPQSPEQLGRILAYLNNSDLDFAIRSGGVGSSSAKDVLISLSAFNKCEFDSDTETLTVGAGQTWGGVDQALERQAPGYAGEEPTANYRCLAHSLEH
jgi:FAD/FMN-containing dehydrogenase